MANLRRQARKYGRLQVAPERATVRSQRRQLGRERKQKIRSNRSMNLALQQAISEAIAGTRKTPGLTEDDLAMAISELARRRTDTAGGAVLARRGIEREYAEGLTETKQSLRELASRQGLAASERYDELLERQRDRQLQKAELKLAQKQFKFDKYIAEEELNLQKIELASEAGGEAKEIRKELKQVFNQGLAALRVLTVGENKKPITPNYVRSNRGEAVNVIAERETKGNRVLAKAIVSKYLDETPTGGVSKYLRRNGLAKLFPNAYPRVSRSLGRSGRSASGVFD